MRKLLLLICIVHLVSQRSCDSNLKPRSGVPATDQTESRAQPDSTSISVSTHGPYFLGRQKRTKVWVHVGRIRFHSPRIQWPESDLFYSITDSTSNVLLRRNFPADGDFEMSFGFSQEEIPRIGGVLVCARSVVPSAPGSGVDYQILGLSEVGQIVSLTGVIETESFKIVFLNTSKGPIPVDPSDSLARPFVESEVWTGYFLALFYHSIFPGGITYDDAGGPFNFERIPVHIDATDARRYRERHKQTTNTIRLFPSPDADQSTAQVVHVLPQSSVRFLDAAYRGGWWLHIIVDGREGFISADDFVTIGLPPAG